MAPTEVNVNLNNVTDAPGAISTRQRKIRKIGLSVLAAVMAAAVIATVVAVVVTTVNKGSSTTTGTTGTTATATTATTTTATTVSTTSATTATPVTTTTATTVTTTSTTTSVTTVTSATTSTSATTTTTTSVTTATTITSVTTSSSATTSTSATTVTSATTSTTTSVTTATTSTSATTTTTTSVTTATTSTTTSVTTATSSTSATTTTTTSVTTATTSTTTSVTTATSSTSATTTTTTSVTTATTSTSATTTTTTSVTTATSSTSATTTTTTSVTTATTSTSATTTSATTSTSTTTPIQCLNMQWNTTSVTLAGTTGTSGTAANQLNQPWNLFVDTNYNMYIADSLNHRIQYYPAGAALGTTIAGIPGSAGSSATQLNTPSDVFVDSHGNFYVADRVNSRIQFFANGSTTGSTVTSGWSGTGGFRGVLVDSANNVFGSDTSNNALWKNHTVPLGYNGAGGATNQLNGPQGIAVDTTINVGYIYIANANQHTVVQWVPGASTGTVVAGSNGVSGTNNSTMNYPVALKIDPLGNLFVVDNNNHRIQLYCRYPSVLTYGRTIAGTRVLGSTAVTLNYPSGIALDKDLNLHVADTSNHRIQKFNRIT